MRTKEQKSILWARFRDDIYIPWTHGQELLEVFHEWLNNSLPGIKFTKKIHHMALNFLKVFFTVVKITRFKLNHTVRHVMNILT